MVKTIGNPLTWLAQGTAGAGSHLADAVDTMRSKDVTELQVRTLSTDDLRDALRMGYDDFKASRADVMFLCLIYPVIGGLLAALTLNLNLIPMLFPVAAGFAILGPFAAVGVYEISRRREAGQDVNWLAAFRVLNSPSIGAIMALGFLLIVVFMAWLIAANSIYDLTLGPEPPTSLGTFAAAVFGTPAGWLMIALGMSVGFLFALAVLASTVVSFPLALDRKVGVPVAISTSIQVFQRNPRVLSIWGLIVASGLVLGSIPLFIGLIVVLPILGHATWHLYRRAVA